MLVSSPPSSLKRLVRCQANTTAEVTLLEARVRVTGPGSVLDGLAAIRTQLPAWLEPPSWERQPTDLLVRLDDAASGLLSVLRDGVLLLETHDEGAAAAALEWALVDETIRQNATRYLLVHAGAVGLDGQGVILPAQSGGGKSTLVAALIASGGFEYFSDEVAVVGLETRGLLPLAKSIVLRNGSRRALEGIIPELRTRPYQQRFDEVVTYLPAAPQCLPSGPQPVRFVVAPRYVPGGGNSLTPLHPTAALRLIVEQSFNARLLGSRAIRTTAALVREAQCFELQFDEVADAVSRLRACLATAAQ